MGVTELIKLIKKKDERGYSSLYDQYSAALYGVIIRIVKSNTVSEEVLQSSFMKIFDNIESFDPEKGTFYTWMNRIARNSALDIVRLKKFSINERSKEFDSTVYNDVTEIDTSNIDVQRMFSSIEEKYKIVLDHIYLKGFNHRETAEILKIPLGTVKSRIRVAISQIREEFKTEEKFLIGLFCLLFILILTLWM